MLTRRLFAKALYLLFAIALLVALLGAAPVRPRRFL
jgi:hypothetical protein